MTNKRTHKVAAGAIPPTLPPSVEEAYRKKCIELKRRMAEVEQSNDSFRLRKTRLLRGIRKLRLERTILLDLLGKRMEKNKEDGYYDYESENSSEIPATPNDKPLRNKRSHRRTAASPPPILSQHRIVAPHQHPQSVLPPYQSQHELSFSVQTPNGISHIPSHPSHPELFSTHDLRPSRDSQISFPASAFDYFLEDQFYSAPSQQRLSRSDEDILEDGHAAWSRLTAEQTETFYMHWTHGLARWRNAMEELAVRTGEPPRGQRDLGRMDGASREADGGAAASSSRGERREGEGEEQTAGEEKRVASSGFTSIN